MLDRLTIDRKEVIAALHGSGIGASVHFIPLHLHPYYQREWGWRPEDLPSPTTVGSLLSPRLIGRAGDGVSVDLAPRMSAARLAEQDVANLSECPLSRFAN